jgi:hypothetical protein
MLLGRVDENFVPLLDDPAGDEHAHALDLDDLVVRHGVSYELRTHLAAGDTQADGRPRLREAERVSDDLNRRRSDADQENETG